MLENNHMITKQQDLQLDKVDQKLNEITSEKMDDILTNFEEFKAYLHNKIQLGKNLGLSEEKLALTAEKVAGYLAENVEPRNREEKLLQELWAVGNDNERHHLAHLLVKLAE